MSTANTDPGGRRPSRPIDIAAPKATEARAADPKSELFAAARDATTAETLKAVERRETELRASGDAIRRRRLRITTLGLVIAALVGLLVVRPSWLGGRAQPVPEPTDVREAHARGTVALAANLLQAHLRQHGTLPPTLAVFGTALPADLRYTRLDDRRFLLERGDLALRSEDDVSAFLKGKLAPLRLSESK